MVGKHNVLRDLEEVKRSLGICPQFDCVFELLTVEEHLEFYTKVQPTDFFPVQKYDPICF